MSAVPSMTAARARPGPRKWLPASAAWESAMAVKLRASTWRRSRTRLNAPLPIAPSAARATWGRKIEPYSGSLKPWRPRRTALLAAKLTMTTPWKSPARYTKATARPSCRRGPPEASAMGAVHGHGGEPHLALAGHELGEQRQIRAHHGGDLRVAAGGGTVGHRHD